MCPKDRYFSEIWGVDLSMTGAERLASGGWQSAAIVEDA